MKIAEIRDLANQLIQQDDGGTTTIYLLEPVQERPSPQQINRTAGNPIGIAEEDWPVFEDLKMEHAITLDLDSVPAFKAEMGLEAKAVAVFVSSLLYNQAYEPGNEEVAVVFLSQRDIERGEVACDATPLRMKERARTVQYFEEFSRAFGLRYRLMSLLGMLPRKSKIASAIDVEDTEELVDPGTFNCHEVTVPSSLFCVDQIEVGSRMEKLREGVEQYSIVGGEPMWIQSAEYDKKIVLQFHNGLVDMVLGDAGVMYVFQDTAFWQCR